MNTALVSIRQTTLRTDWRYRWRNPMLLPQPLQAELPLEYARPQGRAGSSICKDNKCAQKRPLWWSVLPTKGHSEMLLFPFSLALLMQKEMKGTICLHLRWLHLSLQRAREAEHRASPCLFGRKDWASSKRESAPPPQQKAIHACRFSAADILYILVILQPPGKDRGY